MEKQQNNELHDGIYWVGAAQQDESLHCNPYLLIEGDEGVLFDPGSVLDFEYVYANVTALIPLEKIKYVVLHHQDPDLCSSVPLFEQKGSDFKIVTHWRTQAIVKYYGVKSDYYIVNENDFQLTLKTGRKLDFVQTPYLHFPGAITTYDSLSKILFSSDLFGAMSYEWTLYAGEDYLEKMKTFHEHYMPSNDILRPVMEVFLKMDISMIAPQHGSIINSDIKKHIRVLRELECGAFLKPIRKELSQSGGYMMLASAILQRSVAIFGPVEVSEVVENLDIELDSETLEITNYNYTGDTLWDTLFEEILIQKGLKWLTLLEPCVQKLSREYDVPMPAVFTTAIKKSYELEEQNQSLRQLNQELEYHINETNERLTRCPVTGLYNFDFFKEYLATSLRSSADQHKGAMIILNIDHMAKLKFDYGDDEVNEILKNTVYLMEDIKEEDGSVLFRLYGATFAWYSPNPTKERVLEKAEELRNLVSTSQSYIENITLSMGVVFFDELDFNASPDKQPFEVVYELGMLRVKLASTRGKNQVCSNSDLKAQKESVGKILIADIDEVNLDVLKAIFENLKYDVFTATDGVTALAIAQRELPDVIITEIMLPQKDAFIVRESLLTQSSTKDIHFIIISHLKSEASLKRALGLGIVHYLKKPFMLSELLGIIKIIVKGDAY